MKREMDLTKSRVIEVRLPDKTEGYVIEYEGEIVSGILAKDFARAVLWALQNPDHKTDITQDLSFEKATQADAEYVAETIRRRTQEIEE